MNLIGIIIMIVFVKNFVPGNVKTMLAKNIGNTGALNVYKQLFNITLNVYNICVK